MDTQKQQKELMDLLLKTSADKKVFNELLTDLMTPSELTEMATRWQIVKRLSAGESQRNIATDLKIGIATVTRGSRALSNSKGGFKKILTKKTK